MKAGKLKALLAMVSDDTEIVTRSYDHKYDGASAETTEAVLLCGGFHPHFEEAHGHEHTEYTLEEYNKRLQYVVVIN
jgi:hypothetical protein